MDIPEFQKSVNTLRVLKIFRLLSGHYGSTWNNHQTSEQIENITDAWIRALDGVTEENILYGQAQISLARSYVDFPPNAGQFRNLCLGMPKIKKLSVVTLPYILSPEEELERLEEHRKKAATFGGLLYDALAQGVRETKETATRLQKEMDFKAREHRNNLEIAERELANTVKRLGKNIKIGDDMPTDGDEGMKNAKTHEIGEYR